MSESKPGDRRHAPPAGSTELLDSVESGVGAVLRHASERWLSVPASEPTPELTAFFDDVSPVERAPVGVAEQRTSPVSNLVAKLLPSPGRAALAGSLAAVAAAAVALSFAASGRTGEVTASGGPDDDGGTSTSTTSTSEVARGSVESLGLTRIQVLDAGTADIVIVDGELLLQAFEPAPGWTVTVEEPVGVDLSYRRGDDRVDLDVEIEDGGVRVRIRDRRTDERFVTDLLTGHSFPVDDDDHDDDDDRHSTKTDDDYDDGAPSGDSDDGEDEDDGRPDDDRDDAGDDDAVPGGDDDAGDDDASDDDPGDADTPDDDADTGDEDDGGQADEQDDHGGPSSGDDGDDG